MAIIGLNGMNVTTGGFGDPDFEGVYGNTGPFPLPDKRLPLPAGVASKARFHLFTNTLDADLIVHVLKNGVSIGSTSVAAAVTGGFTITIADGTFAAGDRISWRGVTASVGGQSFVSAAVVFTPSP